MSDLRERVPGHSLIDELLNQWDIGTIHVDAQTNGVVIDEDAEGWYRGVIGERQVAAQLAQLGDGWTVLHSVPVGRGTSDIDHVVIGPPGVFTINTKFSPGKDVWVAGRGMYVGGTKQHYVTNALHEARRASTYLSQRCGLTVPVIGVIAFVDPARMTHKAPAGGDDHDPEIRVVRHTELLNVLRTRAEFSDEQVLRIASAAVQPQTWHETPSPSTAGSHIVREFEALEEAVGPRLSMPRGQVRVARPQSQRPARSYSSARSQSSRGRSTSSRSRRPRRSLGARLLTDVLMPVGGFILVWIIYQQILEGWLAGR